MSIVIGTFVGLILALTGAGGTIVAVPLLMFGLHLEVATAAPIALLAVCAASGTGTLLGLRDGIVRYRAAGLIAAVGALVTPLGVMLAHRLPAAPLALLFAVVLVYVAQRMFREARSGANATPTAPPCGVDPATGRLRWTWRCMMHMGLAGAITGMLSGLLGVGGGFVIVPALRRTTDLPMQSIVASSLMAIALVSAAAVAATSYAGHLDWHTALPFVIATLVGMLLGRRIAGRISGPKLQQGFAVSLALVAIGLVVRTLAPFIV